MDEDKTELMNFLKMAEEESKNASLSPFDSSLQKTDLDNEINNILSSSGILLPSMEINSNYNKNPQNTQNIENLFSLPSHDPHPFFSTDSNSPSLPPASTLSQFGLINSASNSSPNEGSGFSSSPPSLSTQNVSLGVENMDMSSLYPLASQTEGKGLKVRVGGEVENSAEKLPLSIGRKGEAKGEKGGDLLQEVIQTKLSAKQLSASMENLAISPKVESLFHSFVSSISEKSKDTIFEGLQMKAEAKQEAPKSEAPLVGALEKTISEIFSKSEPKVAKESERKEEEEEVPVLEESVVVGELLEAPDPRRPAEVVLCHRWCSWCWDNCEHQQLENNWIGRNRHICLSCEHETVYCMACKSAMARCYGPQGADKVCYKCDGVYSRLGRDPHHLIKRGRCSWCCKETDHKLYRNFFLLRSVYECLSCHKKSIPCRKCSHFARCGKDWSEEFCLVCQKLVSGYFSSLSFLSQKLLNEFLKGGTLPPRQGQ